MAANLFAEATDWRTLTLASKPLLMLCLLAYYLFVTHGVRSRAKGLLIVAILTANAGDIFLLFAERGELFFLLGLSAFLLTHLAYGLTFLHWSRSGTVRPYALWLGLLLFWLVFNLGLRGGIPPGLQFPVGLYSLVIMVMVAMAYRFTQTVATRRRHWVWWGALFFLLSDTLIGLGKFADAREIIPHLRVWIMLTYLTGQYLLIRGAAEAILWVKK
jgi:uncharacterized membrane protein YhhN